MNVSTTVVSVDVFSDCTQKSWILIRRSGFDNLILPQQESIIVTQSSCEASVKCWSVEARTKTVYYLTNSQLCLLVKGLFPFKSQILGPQTPVSTDTVVTWHGGYSLVLVSFWGYGDCAILGVVPWLVEPLMIGCPTWNMKVCVLIPNVGFHESQPR